MLVEDLRKFDLFQDLDDVGLKKCLQFAKYKKFQSGTEIFAQGSQSAGLFYILDGEVEVLKKEEGGSEKVVDVLKAGDFDGEESLFGDVEERETSLRARTLVRVFWINTLEYRRLQNSGPMELSKILLRIIIGLANTFRGKNGEFGKVKKELEELLGPAEE